MLNVISDPESLAEANFMLNHGGTTRAQYREAMRDRDESDRQADLAAHYDVAVAGKTARARLSALVAWRNRTAGELDALNAKRVKLNAAVDAPAAVQAKRQSLLQMLAQLYQLAAKSE